MPAAPVDPPFVVVRFPGLGVVLGHHTKAVPGSRADTGVAATRVDPDGVSFLVVAALRGFSPAQVEAVRRDLETTYGHPATITRQVAGDTVLTYGWAARDLKSPTLQALTRFQHAFGSPWSRVQAGEVLMYAPARGPDDGAAALEALRGHLANLGVPGSVEVRRLAPEDLAAYERIRRLTADAATVQG